MGEMSRRRSVHNSQKQSPSLLLHLLATMVFFLILILTSLISSLLSLMHVSTTFVIFVARFVLDFDTARTIGISFVQPISTAVIPCTVLFLNRS